MALVTSFCVCCTRGKRLGFFKSTSVQPLTRSTIREFSSRSAQWKCGSVLSVGTVLQHVVVDCCRSTLFNMVSVVHQESVLGQPLFLICPSEPYYIKEINFMVKLTSESTLVAVLLSPGDTVAESLYSDPTKVTIWSDIQE